MTVTPYLDISSKPEISDGHISLYTFFLDILNKQFPTTIINHINMLILYWLTICITIMTVYFL